MKKTLFALFLLLSFSSIFAQKSEKEHRIVFHLSNADTLVHKALVTQVVNVLEVWKNAKIEVVVHNNGIGFMKTAESRVIKEIEALKAQGVVFAVCENTLKKRKIEKTQILPSATFVPVGLAEIIMKEEEGWSYIKAGF